MKLIKGVRGVIDYAVIFPHLFVILISLKKKLKKYLILQSTVTPVLMFEEKDFFSRIRSLFG